MRGILKVITDALTQTRHRNGLPYDGIMGMLPDWMPAHLAREFFKARDEILREYSHADALEFLRKRRAAFAPDDVPVGGAFVKAVEPIPPAIRADLDTLVKIQDIAAGGLDAYLGKAATDGLRAKAISERQSWVGKHTRERRLDDFSAVLWNIVSDNHAVSVSDVFAKLERMAGTRRTIIQSVTDELVEWVNAKGKIEKASRANVKDRISHIRSKLRDRANPPSRT